MRKLNFLASLPGSIFPFRDSVSTGPVSHGRRKKALKLAICRVFCCLFLFSTGHANAASYAGPLNSPAISIRDPSDTILINITRAGSRLVAVGAQGAIVYSDDNGQTWHQSLVPTSETLTSVGFSTPKIGWAGGGQGIVLRSVDSGVSWQKQIDGSHILPLMNATAATFAASDPDSDAAKVAVRRAGIFASDGADKPFLTITPLSPESVLVFGAYRMTIETTDEGKTWSDWSLHVGDPISHAIYDSVQVGPSIYLVGEDGVVLSSVDGGNNFGMLSGIPDGSTLFGIVHTKDDALVTFGVAGEVFRSTDQGKSWSRSVISASPDLTAGITLDSGSVVVVSEGGKIYLSKDNGKTFNQLDINVGMALFGIIQAANGDVVLVGSGGVRVLSDRLFS
jgi:photosystem II stability/assembly factor-like uncharacterized protein